jgi:hypothetical protein
MSNINIKGLEKAKILAALYNTAKLVIPSATKPGIMTEEEAQKIIDAGKTRIEYIYGRIMKIDITGDDIDPWGYDRDNGEGAVAKIVQEVRDGKHAPSQKKKTTTERYIKSFFSKDEEQSLLKGKEYKIATMFPKGLDIWFSTLKFKAQLVKSKNKPGYEGYEFAESPNIFRLIIGEGENEKRVFDWIRENGFGQIVD